MRPKRLRHPSSAPWLVVGWFILVGAGCHPSPVAEADVPTLALAATVAPAHSPTSTATAEPKHSPMPTSTRPTDLPLAPPSPTPLAVGETVSRTPHPTTQLVITPTQTAAPPTFTPPPPPPPPAGEHLVLQRPVPGGGTTWTDKSYPYGGTRGGALRPHHGVEFSVPTGTPVLAVAPGTIVVAGDDSSAAYGPEPNFYGNLVIVELAVASDIPIFALYGHLSAVLVSVGQSVTAGDVLGLSGDSGLADGPHLHFEVRVGENSYATTRNPLLWLAPQRQMGVVAGRITGPGGALLHEAPITLQRIDAPAPYTATASYASSGPNADGTLSENFAVDDVVPGYYQVIAGSGRQRSTTELWVFPDRVNWVELTIGAP